VRNVNASSHLTKASRDTSVPTKFCFFEPGPRSDQSLAVNLRRTLGGAKLERPGKGDSVHAWGDGS